MPVFFAFSDESGKYKKERNDKFISKNPFYCRSAVLIEAQDWLKLHNEFFTLKKEHLNVEYNQEIKWSYVWSLYKHRQKKEKIPQLKPYFPFRNHSLDLLVEFIRKTFMLLNKCENCQIILTLTFNDREKTKPVETKKIVKLHLNHMLDAVETEMKYIPESVCVVFLNPEEPLLEKQTKEAFSEIYGNQAQLKYPHIKDSVNFEYFSQSFGSQLADYTAGVFNGCCRLYPQSIDLFRHQIWPKIVTKENKTIGYGITEIPKNLKNRIYLEQILEKVFMAKAEDIQISLEERLKSKN
ncbi:MAG: DUF3800 domain-containing protein [Candidatus Aminicenantaceae bacterium]